MKTYKEYYKFGQEHYLDWKSKQKEEWWKTEQFKGHLELKGDYIETTTPSQKMKRMTHPSLTTTPM